MADSNNPTPGEITCMAGGGVAIIASFLDFVGGDGYGSSRMVKRWPVPARHC